MPLKFAANLSFMFKEWPELLDRYGAAKNAGFAAVEAAFPYSCPLDKLVDVKQRAGVQQVLINSWPGDLERGELGIAALPGRQEEFKSTLETSIKYANALDCKKIHIMAGKIPENGTNTGMESVYEENLKYAAKRFKEEGIIGLIEPINEYSVPRYFLNSYHDAMAIIKRINSPNIQLMMDIFNLQILHGNLTNIIIEMMPFAGHVQIAQVPDRHEPNSKGEIDFKYVFELLEKLGYDDWIGCEYTPKGSTVDGLGWIVEFKLEL